MADHVIVEGSSDNDGLQWIHCIMCGIWMTNRDYLSTLNISWKARKASFLGNHPPQPSYIQLEVTKWLTAQNV